MRLKKSILIGFISILIFLVSYHYFGQLSFAQEERYSKLQIFTKVLNLVQQYYVEEIDVEKLIYGGIKGMLRVLDPHTNFLPPDIFKEFESETSGEFGGLGIEITVKNGVLTVISPIEDTPAWHAGIKPGDRIVEINGKSTKGMSLVEAAKEMRGKKGDKVKLGIYRDGFEKPKIFTVQRGTVKIHSVKFTDLEEGYGYYRITSFIENTSKDLEKAIDAHEKKSKDLKGIIIDLRENPGGLLDQAIKVSDLFLEGGVIVTTIGRNNKEKEVVYARAPGTKKGFPVIVLINEYSASASEIVAGALKDNGRALIMGNKSFGKGSVQSVVRLGDGSGLKLTVARYYTPSGKSIQAEGIVPDIILDKIDFEAYKKSIIKGQVQREQDIAGHLLGEQERQDQEETKDKSSGPNDSTLSWWPSSDKKEEKLSPGQLLIKDDYQIFQAYNYLKAWKMIQKFGEKQIGVQNSIKPSPKSDESKSL